MLVEGLLSVDHSPDLVVVHEVSLATLLNFCWYLDGAWCVITSYDLKCQLVRRVKEFEIARHLKEVFPFRRKAVHGDDFVPQLEVRLDRRTVFFQLVDEDIFTERLRFKTVVNSCRAPWWNEVSVGIIELVRHGSDTGHHLT